MERVLLIVDDEIEIGKIIQKTLRREFDEILVAVNTTEAEPLLESRSITHLVVDLFLGPDEMLGYELVRKWRPRLEDLRYVALFTGSSMELETAYDGIDAVFRKPSGYADLIAALRASLS